MLRFHSSRDAERKRMFDLDFYSHGIRCDTGHDPGIGQIRTLLPRDAEEKGLCM